MFNAFCNMCLKNYGVIYPFIYLAICILAGLYVTSPFYLNRGTSNESTCDLTITLSQLFFMCDNKLFIMCGVPFYFMKPGVYHLPSSQNDTSRLFWSWCQDQFDFNL